MYRCRSEETLSALVHVSTCAQFSRSSPHPSSLQFPLFPCPCRALAKLANILEPIGLQEEAEVPGQILAEFVMVCSRW